MNKDLALALLSDVPELFDLPRELIERLALLFTKSWKSRKTELEFRIQYGRDLADLIAHSEDKPIIFNRFLEKLEISEREARRRIAVSATWDVIKLHIETNHLSIEMPDIISHFEELFAIPLMQRGYAWEMFYNSRDRGSYYNAKHIAAFVENYKALPVPTEVSSTDSDQDEFGYDAPPTLVAEVPQGTKEAEAHVAAPGSAPGFIRPEGVRAAIDKIADICGEGWRVALNQSDRVSNEDVLSWANEKDKEDIKEIARLIGGDHKTGVRNAIKLIHKQVGDNTKIWELKRLALGSEDGKYIYESLDHYRVVVTDLNIKQ